MIRTTLLAIAVGIGFLTTAHADHERPFPDPSVIMVPPPQFDPRVRGVPKAKVYYIDHSQMYRICSNNGANANIGPGVLACAKPKKGQIFLPRGMSIPLRNAVLRHERGHMWGWKHAKRTGDVLALDLDDLHHEEGQ